MNDRFSQETTIRLAAPADVWRMATDIEAIVEAALGQYWARGKVEYRATTPTQITFLATDLTTLRDEVDHHGAPLRSFVINASYHGDGNLIQIWAQMYISAGQVTTITVDAKSFRRVEVEAMTHSTDRMVHGLRRRTRWKDASLAVGELIVWSTSSPSHEAPMTSLRTRGLRSTARRTFVRNRDGIIVGLASSTFVSVGIILAQNIGWLPIPGQE